MWGETTGNRTFLPQFLPQPAAEPRLDHALAQGGEEDHADQFPNGLSQKTPVAPHGGVRVEDREPSPSDFSQGLRNDLRLFMEWTETNVGLA